MWHWSCSTRECSLHFRDVYLINSEYPLCTCVSFWTFSPCGSSETQGQSVGSGEKAGWKFSSMGERAPGYRLLPNYFQKFKRMPAPDWAQKMLCIIVPNRRTVSLEFFSWVRTWWLCLDHVLTGSYTKNIHAVRKLSVWFKIPIWFQNTVCPKTKDAFPKIQAWAYNRCLRLNRPRLAEILGSFSKIPRRLTATKTSLGKVNSHFFSLYRNYFNSLTLSHASQLFWSWISINHIQEVHEENEFCYCLFTSFTKVEIRHFHG